MSDIQDLRFLIYSNTPLVAVETYEETKALALLRQEALKQKIPAFSWSITDGLQPLDEYDDIVPGDTHEPLAALNEIKYSLTPSLFILCDFHQHIFDDPVLIRLLREIAMNHEKSGHQMVLLSPTISLPDMLTHYAAHIKMQWPNDDKIRHLILQESQKWSNTMLGKPIKLGQNTLETLVNSVQGLALADVNRLIHGAIWQDRVLQEDADPLMGQARKNLMNQGDIISFEYDTSHFGAVAGLRQLKQSLERCKDAILSPNQPKEPSSPATASLTQERKKLPPLDPSLAKGLLLFGVKGSGKSLAARAAAGLWEVPLLRVNMAAFQSAHCEQTREHLKEIIASAERLSPCILWLDEIETALEPSSVEEPELALGETYLLGNDSAADSEKGSQQLEDFRQWIKNKQSQVFVMATSNDIQKVPQAWLDRSLFSEHFFIDLPKLSNREQLIWIHLDKRGQDPKNFDIPRLAQACEEFSGAEIEQAIAAGVYCCNSQDKQLDSNGLLEELHNITPWAMVHQKEIAELRKWAKGRSREAH